MVRLGAWSGVGWRQRTQEMCLYPQSNAGVLDVQVWLPQAASLVHRRLVLSHHCWVPTMPGTGSVL